MIDLTLVSKTVGGAMALGLACAGAADADTIVPLPGGDLTQTLSDGTVLHLRLDGESATLSPSMGGDPFHRNAWVTGSAHVDISGVDGDIGGAVFPGYTVGCQIDLAGGGGNTGGSLQSTEGQNTGPDARGSGGSALTLGPGQTRSFFVLDREEPDKFGAEIHQPFNPFQGNSTSVTWSDETIGLSGCAGYAQARAFVSVLVKTANISSWTTLWGQPFSLG